MRKGTTIAVVLLLLALLAAASVQLIMTLRLK